MKSIVRVLFIMAVTFATGVARAEEGTESRNAATSAFSLAATIGEGMYFINNDVYRGPVTLELVPSFGRSWLKVDLGLSTTLESVQIAGTNVGNWNFTFRPGARLTPPIIPVYFRAAVPLQFQRHDFDWGLMFGVGDDIRILDNLGIVLEVDTTLSKNLEWGGDGIPLEFRAGVSLYF